MYSFELRAAHELLVKTTLQFLWCGQLSLFILLEPMSLPAQNFDPGLPVLMHKCRPVGMTSSPDKQEHSFHGLPVGVPTTAHCLRKDPK